MTASPRFSEYSDIPDTVLRELEADLSPVDWHYRFREPHNGAQWGPWKRIIGSIEECRALFAGCVEGEPNRDETKMSVEFRALYARPPRDCQARDREARANAEWRKSMTHEQAIWYWLQLSLVEKQRATRRMLEDGRVVINEQMDLVSTAGEFRERAGDSRC